LVSLPLANPVPAAPAACSSSAHPGITRRHSPRRRSGWSRLPIGDDDRAVPPRRAGAADLPPSNGYAEISGTPRLFW
jgi:hypothetical protein